MSGRPTPGGRGPAQRDGASSWRLVRRLRRGEAGQSIGIVLGVCLVLTLGSMMLVQNTWQQYPIVTKDVVQHEAYRAMLSGVDEYLYKMNANADYAACSAKFYNSSGTLVGNSALTGASTVCAGLTFNTWISVPGTSSVNGPPSWFWLSPPSVNIATGNSTLLVVGSAGYPNTYNYQTATLTLQPLNSFLLNVLWINYNQIDPQLIPGDPACTYYWPSGSLVNNCLAVDFVSADSLSGNLFVNDSIFVCGTPTFKTAYTADPNEAFVSDCGGSGATITGHGAQYYQTLPTDDSALATVAANGGCLYEGPTTITLTGATMSVTSNATPTGLPAGAPGTSLSNDSLNDPANTANVCMPSSPGGSVNLPTNGVIFVENCDPATDSLCVSGNNPLANAGEPTLVSPQWEAGDAIVQGSITTPTTIGTANNVVIDGNLCYTDDVSGGTCTASPAAPSTNVLGLVALNYVELNHPVTGGGNNQSTCPAGLGNGAVTCDQQNPIVDAVILALNHSFLVNNWNKGSPLGSITLNGTIDQDWRGAVGTDNSGTIVTGYSKNYQYDSRLTYLSPPYYLNPGTSQWGFAAFTVLAGSCKVPTGSGLACPTPAGAYP